MAYCFITGSSNPVVRATVMGIMFLLGFFIKREANIYNILSFAALAIIFFRPNQLFDIGFQLSFVSVISIVFFYPKLSAFFKVDSCKAKAIKFLLEGLLVSFSAWLGTLWLVAYYFKIFSPVTVLANMFFGLFFLPLAGLFASCLQPAVALLLYLNNLFLKLPGAYWYLP
jgi:competence protein ComEC